MWRLQDKSPSLVESHYFGGPDSWVVNGLGLAMLDRVPEVHRRIKLRWRTAAISPSYGGLPAIWVPLLAERISGEETHRGFTSSLHTITLFITEDPPKRTSHLQPVTKTRRSGQWAPVDGAAASERPAPAAPTGTALGTILRQSCFRASAHPHF